MYFLLILFLSKRYLLGKKADIDLANLEGWNALYFAIANGHMHLVQTLIDARSDIFTGANVVHQLRQNMDSRFMMQSSTRDLTFALLAETCWQRIRDFEHAEECDMKKKKRFTM